jgi:hypothetical protein
VDNIGRVDVLVAWISVLVLIFVFVITPITFSCGFCGVILNDLLHVDALEDTTVFHCVIGSRVELAWTFQGLDVIVQIVTMTSEPFDHVDLMVVVAGPLTLEIIMVVAAPVPSFSVFSIISVVRIATIESPTVVTIIISSRRVVGLLASPDVFSNQFLRVIGVSVILGSSEELTDRGRPFMK